jgi:hypothetical protein
MEHPLAGLVYVATICAASDGAAQMLHVSARHSFGADGTVTSALLAGPPGSHHEGPLLHGTAQLIAEQGDSLAFQTRSDDDPRTTTVLLTLHSATVGELCATTEGEWVRAIAAIESLPLIAHQH